MLDPRPTLLCACDGVPMAPWVAALERALPEVDVRVWPDIEPGRRVDYGLAWNNPTGFWRDFPNLKAIFSLGAGVDGLLADPTLPSEPWLVRMRDPALTRNMMDFVLMRTLHHHRLLHRYEADRIERRWQPLRPPLPQQRTVGILGLGELGHACATDLATRGFDVRGWSRALKNLAGVATYAGRDQLQSFASACDILICLLPLTPETRGVLNAELFGKLTPGASLVHVGRGAHLVEADLLNALDNGQLGAATLDVFAVEPLPPEHVFWSRPEITIFPHVAAFTHPPTAALVLAGELARIRAGQSPEGAVDRETGY